MCSQIGFKIMRKLCGNYAEIMRWVCGCQWHSRGLALVAPACRAPLVALVYQKGMLPCTPNAWPRRCRFSHRFGHRFGHSGGPLGFVQARPRGSLPTSLFRFVSCFDPFHHLPLAFYNNRPSMSPLNSTINARRRWLSSNLFGLFVILPACEKNCSIGTRGTNKP